MKIYAVAIQEYEPSFIPVINLSEHFWLFYEFRCALTILWKFTFHASRISFAVNLFNRLNLAVLA
jgi:hypothetical protein